MNINLGRTKEEEEVNFYLGREGVCVILGMTLCGKTSLLMNTLIKASKQRQIIIFSYGGEYNNMIYSNCESREPDNLDVNNTELIEDVKVRISDLDEYEYWRWLTTATAARFCTDLARNRDLHQDIPELFREVIERTPVSVRYSQEKAIHEESKKSLLNSWEWIETMLSTESIDWEQKVRSGKNIIINLNLLKEDRETAQFLVGFILHKIRNIIKYTKPVLAFEEADILCNIEQGVSFSAKEIIEYNLKMQKEGVYMFLVSQQDFNLPRTIKDNTTKFVYGKFNMSGDTFLSKQVNSIKWRHYDNYREFVYYDLPSGFIRKFVPNDIYCYINKR